MSNTTNEMAGNQRTGVLLTEGSSSSSRQAIYALAGRYRIGVLDSNRFCQSRFSRHARFHRCPHFADEPKQYLRFVSDTMRKHDYEVLLPTHDQVFLLSRFQSVLGRHVRSVLPEFESLCHLQSKVAFYKILRELGLPSPETEVLQWPTRTDDPPQFPCYVKADHGTAGEGVRLVDNQPQLATALNELELAGLVGKGSRYLIQQPCSGTHSVVQCVFRHGTMVAIHCAETLRRGVGGGQGLRVGVEHPPVVDHMRLLGQHLNWHGPLFLEYFYDTGSQHPEYIEANPRIGETLNATLSGINLCQLAVDLAMGLPVTDEMPRGATGIRSHVDFLLLMAEAIGGSGRPALLKTLTRMLRKSGEFSSSGCEMTRPSDDWASLIPAVAAVAQVLVAPSAASRLVGTSTRRCSLTDSAAAAIQSLAIDDVREALSC